MNIGEIAPVRKSVDVRAPIKHAFEIFTAGLPRWWPRDVGVSKTPLADVAFEPRLGGRWLEIANDGSTTTVATVAAWEPPTRLVLLWHVNGDFKPDLAMKSEVEVVFTEIAPNHTRLDLLHHRFETMGDVAGRTLRNGVDGGWGGLLRTYADIAEKLLSIT